MHGHSLGSAVLLNAEVDSMGGVIDGGVGIDNKTSPRQAAIEKAQAELRQEHDVREERKRELEFLEKGGNPLDFKFGSATSVSFQSTSIAEQFVPSEGKGSFALTASPLGDSVESSGRPAVPAGCDPNTADNLLLFDVENGVHEGDRNSIYPSRKTNIDLPDHSSQLDGNHSIKEPGNSVILPLGVKSQAYHRRNRSRPKRDSGRASTADVAPGRDGTGSSTLPSSPHGSRDAKGSVCEASTQKGRMTSSICKSQSTSPNHNAPFKTFTLDGQLEAVQAHGIATGLTKTGQYEGGSDGKAPRHWVDGENNQHVGDQKNSISTTFLTPDLVGEREEQDSGGHECTPSDATAKIENQSSVSQLNGFRNLNRDGKNVQNEGQNSNAAFRAKDLDSEVSCFQANLNLDGNDTRDIYSNGNPKGQIEDTSDIEAVNGVKENNEAKTVDATVMINDVHNGVHQNNSTKGPQFKLHKEMCNNRSSLQEVKSNINVEGIKSNDKSGSNMEKKLSNLLSDNSNSRKASLCPGRTQGTMDSSRCDIVTTGISGMGASSASELLTCTGSHLKLEINKAREDSILEEARIIEAKRKRIAELSVGALPIENRRRSHWDFVLEEMAWLANDFMQERLWKTTAAAQICHQVAFAGRLRFDERNVSKMQRQVAQELAKAVMQFWRSAEVLLNSSDLSVGLKDCKSAVSGSRVDGADESVQNKTGESDMVTSKQLEGENPGKSFPLAVQAYAVRFLKYNTIIVGSVQAETPVSTNRISNFFRESSWKEDQFVGGQENLFYTVPAGAMETYRKHIESYMVPLGRSGSITQREEVETSMYDGVEDFGSRVTVYEEEEGETSTYYMAGTCEGRKSLKSGPKKRKNLPKSYTAKSYDLTAGLPYENCMENKLGTQQSFLVGKRPASNPHAVSIPTKRVRTAARHRVISPFSVGPAVVHTTNKNDISSGDTSSFQDDLSTLVDGSHFKKSLEVESSGDFGKQMPFDCTEISTKPKKKKKAKNLGSAYEQRWQLDSMVQSEQRDPLKRRLESHLFESNGNGGLFSQHTTKKPKIKHPLDTSESMTPLNGSLPSPVASQMSNMSNSNKLMKMIAGRDRGRKAKALKMPAGQSGSGSPWSLFEDQALVVLVHDMGPNWELVSDAINSTLQFKCIFRKAKECKERHKILMDRNTGDGADSAEDSGCSQPYPSTLPGIPKGSARQLFERLQGPMEEDILKAHFEKIILIGQNKHSRRSQSDSQDLKQLVQVHNSHALTLSQVCPNNLNGGSLTPLDLCEETTSSSDLLSLGYQGPHSSGLAISNQGSVAPALTSSGGNTMLGSSLPLPPAAPNTSYRDGRFGVPRSASLPIEEQQRVQQYNHMISGRTIHPSSLSAPRALSVSDRGVRMLPGGSGMGMMCGMNRNMMMARPGYQGIASPAMLTSGSMLSSCGLGMPNHANMHSGTGSGPGNAMLRPQEALHMMRPGQNAEDQRQMMIPELQMQVTEGHSQGTIPFSGLSSGFSNQTVSTPLRTYPVHNQQQHQMTSQQSHLLSNSHHPQMQGTNHATSPQQQTMIRLARERHLHQRYLQQQQHQFAASNASIPHNHAQPQPQNLLSSSLQNGSRIHQQQSSEPVSLPPTNSQHPMTPSSSVMTPISSQHQQKHLVPPNGLVRNPQAGVGGSLTNQMLKPRQRQQQQLQQPVRHHHQQRQQSQSQPHAKLIKGLGRGNMMMHQNLCVDSSHVNGLSTIPGNQVAEKGEQVLHQNQGHGLYSGSGLNPVQPAKQLVPQSSNQPQQKLYPIPLPPSSNQLQQIPSHSESSNQGQVPPIPSGHTFVASQQSAPPLAMASSPHHHHLHPQPQPRQVSQSQQTIQRIIPQNHQVESDPFIKSSVDQVNQQLVNNTFQMSPTTSSSCTESTSVIPIVSSACAPQWKVPEQLYDSGTPGPATHLTAIGNSSLLSPVRSESMLASSPGLTQGQVAGSIPTQRHSVEAQWQQQQQPESQLRPSSPLQHLHQQQQPPPPQNQQQHHHHQHQLHLQQLPQPSPLPSPHQQQQQQ